MHNSKTKTANHFKVYLLSYNFRNIIVTGTEITHSMQAVIKHGNLHNCIKKLVDDTY